MIVVKRRMECRKNILAGKRQRRTQNFVAPFDSETLLRLAANTGAWAAIIKCQGMFPSIKIVPNFGLPALEPPPAADPSVTRDTK